MHDVTKDVFLRFCNNKTQQASRMGGGEHKRHTLPKTATSTAAGSTFAAAIAALEEWTARSVAERPLSVPPKEPHAVRCAETMKISFVKT